MPFTDMQDFIRVLESRGLLKRITAEVDPELEITEIAIRMVREEGPALLFENVKGARFPLVINLLATMQRIEIGLCRHPQQIGEELIHTLEDINPPSISALWRNRSAAMNLMNVRPRKPLRSSAQQIIETDPDLLSMPILKCWPHDGGKFITLPLVRSRDPRTGTHNMGIYRMQVYDHATTGMHMQIQKGGAFHHHDAEQQNQPLEMAVALGGDPALMLSAVIPLPEGIDEAGFAGVMRRKRTPMTRAKTVNVQVPANAEFILEGTLNPHERRLEGPFGDHFGHYSDANQFPVFHINAISRKSKPIYPATVVGKPPQEDRYLGDAAQMATKPLIRLMRKEVHDLWAYYESGFHNLLVVSVDGRYTREHIKTALGILGEGQLSLTKALILVNTRVDPRNPSQVAEAVSRNFKPQSDFHLISRTAQDTLDFTGETFQHGSKMIIDATGFGHPPDQIQQHTLKIDPQNISQHVIQHRIIAENILILKMQPNTIHTRENLERIIRHDGMKDMKIVVAVSNDVNINDNVELIWGIFTRFDCARDVTFSKQTFNGITPIYSGVMGINATWKEGYPEPLEMPPEIIRKVDQRWQEYQL